MSYEDIFDDQFPLTVRRNSSEARMRFGCEILITNPYLCRGQLCWQDLSNILVPGLP
jgi:hypothetical protein